MAAVCYICSGGKFLSTADIKANVGVDWNRLTWICSRCDRDADNLAMLSGMDDQARLEFIKSNLPEIVGRIEKLDEAIRAKREFLEWIRFG